MDSNFYKKIDLEFLELSNKCSSLPIEETKAEWKGKNRYSDNQPCTFLILNFSKINYFLDDKYRIKLSNSVSDYINASNWQVKLVKWFKNWLD